MPTFAELQAAGARIGEIRVVTGDIFDLNDPRENNWLFRLANKLHYHDAPGRRPAGAAVRQRRAGLGAEDRRDRTPAARSALSVRRDHPADRGTRRRRRHRSPYARHLVARHRPEREPRRRRRTRAASRSRRRTCSAPAFRSACRTAPTSIAPGPPSTSLTPTCLAPAASCLTRTPKTTTAMASRCCCSVRSTPSTPAGPRGSAHSKTTASTRYTTRAMSSPNIATGSSAWRRSAAGRRA